MPRPVHFDFPADDPERAIRFYSDVFAWKFEKWEGPMEYWLITTGPKEEPGVDGGMGRRADPDMGVVNTIDVPSVDEYMRKITAAGGKVLQPKMAIPGVGWYTTCQDTEGNAFGIMQDDPTAK
jgi:predicted enzyme related to lactoylglutathione lyase